MSLIYLKTEIRAPIEICFDLSRSIDLHLDSTLGTKEKAIAGVTTGLIGEGEEVTWRARHFGLYFEMTTRISQLRFSEFFLTSMVKGPFKRIEHRHVFKSENGITVMEDYFGFEAPFGIFGRLAELLFLERHMQQLLINRNAVIKKTAESGEWKQFLQP